MNIAQAKETIKTTVKLYLKKNSIGDYVLPVVRQRPVFLLGAPGIGKTAIMEQIAQELGIALVSYSMTHHTRQSALGLPYIEKKEYGGEEFSVSEYTMSEIIASVYDTMEESGLKEGILFLDEINCVSETLYPSMLQFLQYKVFGRHAVPEGWVVVTAGNPPEFNRMVREFDVVTLDRLKLIEVEAELKAWQSYALGKRVHSAILSYLELRQEHFYVMELTEAGREYVTARGWEDLSDILRLYEEEGVTADEDLIRQYLHHESVVRDFAAYYELYRKYEQIYSPEEILKGKKTQAMLGQVAEAPFDERVLLIGMLSERVEADMQEVLNALDAIKLLQPQLRKIKEKTDKLSASEMLAELNKAAFSLRDKMKRLEAASALSTAEKQASRKAQVWLEGFVKSLQQAGASDGAAAFAQTQQEYGKLVEKLRGDEKDTASKLDAMLAFAEEAFADGHELLLLLTRLTVNDGAARYIALFGSERYKRLSEKLLVRERGAQLKEEIGKLDL